MSKKEEKTKTYVELPEEHYEALREEAEREYRSVPRHIAFVLEKHLAPELRKEQIAREAEDRVLSAESAGDVSRRNGTDGGEVGHG